MGQIYRESLTKYEDVTLDFQIPIWKKEGDRDGQLKRITLKDFFASDLVSSAIDPPNWSTGPLTLSDNITHSLAGYTLTIANGTYQIASTSTFRTEGANVFMSGILEEDGITKIAGINASGQIRWKNVNSITNPNAFDKTADDTDDITEGNNKFVTAGDVTKLGHISVSQAVDLDQMETDITANNAKVTNVTTNLSEGTATNTTVDVNSSDGTNATLVSASTLRAGLLTKAKFDEIEANTLKVSNQPTNLSEGTSTVTTVDVNSSDGTNATLAAASTTRAGVMSKAKFDEVTANTLKVGLTAGQITILGNTSGTNTGDQDISGIATNTTAIATNATNIASNDTDIATNATNIATNTTAIALNTAKVTNATHTGEVEGSGALTIASDVVDEDNLKVSNSPTNGHVLTARSGEVGGLKWEAASSIPALNNGQVFVGDASNQAASVSMSGDVAISNTGATTIQPDTVTYDKMQDASGSTMLGNPVAGTGTVQEIPIVQQYLTTGTNTALLEDSANWDVNGHYKATSTSLTGTYQGQAHLDSNGNYWYTAVDDNVWIRLIRG
tara:strand:+ start:791 stop:2464 length:1674 start_codon:yes stop_codon:yes gene_type:complete